MSWSAPRTLHGCVGYNWFQGGSSGSSTGQIHSKLRLIQLVGINSLLTGTDKGPGEEQDGNSQGEGGEPDGMGLQGGDAQNRLGSNVWNLQVT